jgi:hypothetical protein
MTWDRRPLTKAAIEAIEGPIGEDAGRWENRSLLAELARQNPNLECMAPDMWIVQKRGTAREL